MQRTKNRQGRFEEEYIWRTYTTGYQATSRQCDTSSRLGKWTSETEEGHLIYGRGHITEPQVEENSHTLWWVNWISIQKY